MGTKGGEQRQVRTSTATTRSLVEIVAMLAASAFMALLVLGGGIAVERVTESQTSAMEAPAREPAPLSPREST